MHAFQLRRAAAPPFCILLSLLYESCLFFLDLSLLSTLLLPPSHSGWLITGMSDVEKRAAGGESASSQPGSATGSGSAPASSAPPAPGPPDVPDGGWRAWLVVLGSGLTLFASFGVVSGLPCVANHHSSSDLFISSIAWQISGQRLRRVPELL